MKPISFEQTNCMVAKNQDEYLTLPAHHDPENGILTSCWKLSVDEIEIIKETGIIWFQQWTFNENMQPIMMTIENPLLK